MLISVFLLCPLLLLLLLLPQQVSFSSAQVSVCAISLFYRRSFFPPVFRKAFYLLFLFFPLSLLFFVLSSQYFLVWQCLQSHVWHLQTDSLLQNLHLLFVSVL